MFEQCSVIAPPQGDHKGQYRLNKEKGGSMMERDGRPQGPSHPHPRRPRPYDTPIPGDPCIVGAEPIRAYLNGIDHKGSPLLCYTDKLLGEGETHLIER